MAADQLDEREAYLRGIRLFNEQRFFEAHEVWEDLWRESEGVKREFLQGMIQCAVALEHYRRSNPIGVLSLYRSYNAHLGKVPQRYMGLDVKGFMEGMREALGAVIDADPPARRGEITLDPKSVPVIRLIDDDM